MKFLHYYVNDKPAGYLSASQIRRMWVSATIEDEALQARVACELYGDDDQCSIWCLSLPFSTKTLAANEMIKIIVDLEDDNE